MMEKQVNIYEIRKSGKCSLLRGIFHSREEPKLEQKLGSPDDIRLGYCRELVELHGEFGNPFCRGSRFNSLDFILWK